MCDIFTKKDVHKLLTNKHLMYIGSSNTRAIYKDLLWLWNNNTLITQKALKSKLEPSFMGDSLLKGEHLVRGRNYEEVRQFKRPDTCIEFIFITRCYTNAIECLMTEIKKGSRTAPDVIVYNSCLWDLTRWGPNGVQDYKDNLVKLMKLCKQCLPSKTLVIWTATEAVSQDCRGGLFVKQVEFMKHYLRFEVMEANMLARQIVVSHGFDFLDVHYYLRMQIHRRAHDGVHWTPIPVRHVTNLILTHIALSWECELPGHFEGTMLETAKNLLTGVPVEQKDIQLPKVPIPLKPKKEQKKIMLTRPAVASPIVTGSPFRIAMKKKLQTFISLSEAASKEDKENVQKASELPLLDTPKRTVNINPPVSRKPYENMLIRRVTMGHPRSVVHEVPTFRRDEVIFHEPPLYHRHETVFQEWREPDFSNSPVQFRDYQFISEKPRFVYREVTDNRYFQPAPHFSQGMHNGPMRPREMYRRNRRHRPYY